MGVQIWTSTRVTDIGADGVRLGAEFIQARTVIWAAGVEPSLLGKKLVERFGGELDRVGRPKVLPTLELGSETGVFVIGDLAHVVGPSQEPLELASVGSRCRSSRTSTKGRWRRSAESGPLCSGATFGSAGMSPG